MVGIYLRHVADKNSQKAGKAYYMSEKRIGVIRTKKRTHYAKSVKVGRSGYNAFNGSESECITGKGQSFNPMIHLRRIIIFSK